MQSFKIFFIFAILIFLNGCVQPMALLGPGVTMVTTGNALQAGFQYGANKAIEHETGKDAFGHVIEIVEKIEDDNKNKKSFKRFYEISRK